MEFLIKNVSSDQADKSISIRQPVPELSIDNKEVVGIRKRSSRCIGEVTVLIDVRGA
jgi:hypothetical protein